VCSSDLDTRVMEIRRTYWDDVYDSGQAYKTSGWNGIIEAWYFKEILKAQAYEEEALLKRNSEIINLPLGSEVLMKELHAWRIQRDIIQEALIEYENKHWFTYYTLGGRTFRQRVSRL